MKIEYEQKIWLSKTKYLAVLSNALVVVTLDSKGNEIRYMIYKKQEVAK